MKIALLIAGYLRGFHENIDNIKNNIIQNNECDIYMHVTENDLDDKYHNKKYTIDSIRKELNPKMLIISNNFKFSDNKTINNLLNQNYKYYLLNEEKNKFMKIENIHYNIIFKIRPDMHIHEKINFENETNVVYIPKDSKIDLNKLQNINDNHICDIFAYGDSDIMNKYFDYFNNIKNLIEEFGFVNETLLYHYLTSNKIQYNLIYLDYMMILSLCNTIAITGDSGSGKTIISTLLKNIFYDSFILECDRYHKWERKNTNWNKYTHLNPNANYLIKMEKDVFNLKIGNDIFQIDYDHKNGTFTDKYLINSKNNIIVCGLHALYLSDNIVNLKIYMDTDDNLKIPWKITRDLQKRGYSIEHILEQIEKRKEDFNKYIYPQKENADLIIRFFTNKNFDIDTFILNDDLTIYLKIGIKNTITFDKNLSFTKIEYDEKFKYYYFDNNIEDYNKVIETFVKVLL